MKTLILAVLIGAASVHAQTIVNPNPPATSSFSKLWVTSVNLHFVFGTNDGMLQARLAPYDGNFILATGVKVLSLNALKASCQSDTNLAAMVESVSAELVRQSGYSSTPMWVQVMAPDPSEPVRALVSFSDGKMYEIANCYQLASRDPQFAGVFVSAMTEIARQAGLPVQ